MITFASEHIFNCKVRRQETSYRLLFERRMYLEIYFEVLELHINSSKPLRLLMFPQNTLARQLLKPSGNSLLGNLEESL